MIHIMSVEVAVGYADESWESVWVEVEDPGDLSHAELKDLAEDAAERMIEREDVSFIHAFYVEPDSFN